MARISTYVKDTVVTLLDKWIGTDSNGSVTKNFTAGSVAELFNNAGAIGILGQTNFLFQTDSTGGRKSGTISFNSFGGDATPFSDVTAFKVSKKTSGNKLIIDYLLTLIGYDVILAQLDDLNNFGVYKVSNIEQDLVETNFYNITLTLVASNGAMESEKYYGLGAYPNIALSGDKHYTHNQSSAATTWNITHNLNKYPSVTATLSTGQKGYGDVTYIDENNLTITFASAESGKAYMN